MLLVSAADSSHFRSLMQFLRSVRRYERHTAVCVFDLGFTAGELGAIHRAFPSYEVRAFDFSAYPEYFDIHVNAGEYAWKPVIVWEALRESNAPVCWMDAGNALVDDLDGLRKALSVNGFYSPYSSETIGMWTHPGTLRYLGLDEAWRSDSRNLNGACIAFDPAREKALRLAKEWRDGALVRDCIAPKGSDRSNHRQDQALLTVLAYRDGLVEGVDHDALGFKTHQDPESNLPIAIARAAKRFGQYQAYLIRRFFHLTRRSS